MATTMKDLMGSMISMLLAVGFVIALVFLYAADAKATSRPEPGSPGNTQYHPTYPYITQVSPGYDATGVARNSNIKVTFSEAMDPATINAGTFKLCASINAISPNDCGPPSQQIPAEISKDPTDVSERTWVLDPYGSGDGRLEPNTQYMAMVAVSVRDLDDGEPIATSKIWHFTTAAASAPYVTQVSPEGWATGVARNSNLKVTFSEAMDPATVTGTTFRLYRGNYDSAQSIPATVSRDTSDASGRTYVLDPYGSDAGRLDANTQYMVRVTPDVRDIEDGAYMTSDKTWYFTTAPASAPYVTQMSPTSGATGVSRNANAKVTFSEAMDPSSINTSTLQLRYYDVLCTSRYPDPYNPCYFSLHQISATVSKDAADPSGRTWVIDPVGLLYANKNYMVRVTTGVRDIEDGLSISSNKESYFKTGSY